MTCKGTNTRNILYRNFYVIMEFTHSFVFNFITSINLQTKDYKGFELAKKKLDFTLAIFFYNYFILKSLTS